MLQNSDRDRLENAIKQPIAALTAAVVESPKAGRDIVAGFLPALGTRPHALHPFQCRPGQVGQLLSEASGIIAPWPSGTGVVFLLDETPYDVDDTTEFWKAMNLQRENWGALKAHIVFLLNPGDFERFLQAADHLAAWVPLKLDLRQPEGQIGGRDWPECSIYETDFSSSARETLHRLECDLCTELENGTPSEETLVRRFYLPMFALALSGRMMDRARNLFAKLAASPPSGPDLPRWLDLAITYQLRIGRTLDAQNLAVQLMEIAAQRADVNLTAIASGHLGEIARELGDIHLAEQHYRNALSTWEKLDAKTNIAVVYAALGELAKQGYDFDAATKMYHMALEIKEQEGDEFAVAIVKARLAQVQLARGDLNEAERLYLAALEIFEKLADLRDSAGTLHNLGLLHLRRDDFEAAESHFQMALKRFQSAEDQISVAASIHQLGTVAMMQGEFVKAKGLYIQSLKIDSQLGYRLGVARNNHQLGMLAQLEGNESEARERLLASVAICRELGNASDVALSTAQLALVEADCGNFLAAAELTSESTEICRAVGDTAAVSKLTEQFRTLIEAAPESMHAGMWELWDSASKDNGLRSETVGEFGLEHGTHAKTAIDGWAEHG